jgi:hypothetical protein
MWINWAASGKGTMCHLCGHQGATEADHDSALATDPNQPVSWKLLKPAHGVNPKDGRPGPCSHPDCLAINNGQPRPCNQVEGAKRKARQIPQRPTDRSLYTTRKW